jgi:hypothetical protein
VNSQPGNVHAYLDTFEQSIVELENRPVLRFGWKRDPLQQIKFVTDLEMKLVPISHIGIVCVKGLLRACGRWCEIQYREESNNRFAENLHLASISEFGLDRRASGTAS